MPMRKTASRGTPARAEVVCFGMILPALVFIVDQFPEHNTGAYIQHIREFISDDAAIVASLLSRWRVKSALIGTTLGDDARGRAAARKLKQLGVLGKVRLSKSVATPYEVNVSDRSGARTYFWQRDPRVLNTLDTADLSWLDGAKLLYVDWYDGDHILRAMDAARRRGVLVYLNLEHGHLDGRILYEYVPRADIVQANTDAAQQNRDALSVTRKLLDAGAETALITLAREGCIAATRERVIRAKAPVVRAVDGCGAGAAFSAGFIYGHLRGWSLEEKVRLGVAAGSFKCTRIGLDALPLRAIEKMAHQVAIGGAS